MIRLETKQDNENLVPVYLDLLCVSVKQYDGLKGEIMGEQEAPVATLDKDKTDR